MNLDLPECNNEFLAKIESHLRASLATWFSDLPRASQAARRGPVEVDYWSITYRLAFAEHSVFVKIPKMDRYQTEISAILLDPKALQSAQTEFDGFSWIHGVKDWPDGCATVRPLMYLKEFNALITEFTPSVDLFRECRQAVPQLFPYSRSSKRVHDSLHRCGKWLGHFQRPQVAQAMVQVSSKLLLNDIDHWAAEIGSSCSCPRPLNRLLEHLNLNQWSQQMPRARNSEGFEVRNIIVDQAGTVRLVDPGSLSWSSGLDDVAHFLASLTMLYWGTPLLWIGIPLAEKYRRSFLDGWAQSRPEISPRVLAWFEVREWFRQWLDAYKVLDQKPYSHLLRKFLRFAYVDAFFLNRINHSIKLACSQPVSTDSTGKKEER